MKTLIYVLSLAKSGTSVLADSLKTIGIDAHHEVVDTRSVYLRWMKKRFTSNPIMDVGSAKVLWKDELLKRLNGNGYFADISHYLAPLYPIIDVMSTEVIDMETRSVQLTRNFFPHRAMVYSNFSKPEIRIDDNTQYIDRLQDKCYPAELSWCSDIRWEDWVSMSQFERLCWYWKFHNEYFFLGKREIFHVEDFNIRSSEILDELCPEATEGQKEKFNKAMMYTPLSPDKHMPPYTLKMTKQEEEIYERICKPTLKKLGYK